MKKKFILSLVLIFLFEYISAKTDNKKIEEFERKIKSLSGKEKVDILNDLPNEFYFKYPKKCIEFSNHALNISKHINYKFGEAFAFKNLAKSYSRLKQYNKSIESYFKAFIIFKELEDKYEIAECFRYIGFEYYKLSNFKEALKYYNKSLKFFEETGNKKEIARIYYFMGILYKSEAKFEKALNYMKESKKIYEEIGSEDGIGVMVYHIGNIYYELNLYEKSLDNYLKSFKILERIKDPASPYALHNIGMIYLDVIRNFDKAFDFFLKALKIWENMEDRYGVSIALVSIGNTYYYQKKYKKSLEFLNRALPIVKELNVQARLANIYRTMGKIYYDQKKYKISLGYFNKSLESWEKDSYRKDIISSYNVIGKLNLKLKNYDESIKYLKLSLNKAKEFQLKDVLRDNYENLSEYYFIKKDYRRSLAYYKLYHKTEKEIFNEKSDKNLSELQTKYETEKKEKEIEVLKRDKEIQNLKLRQQKMIRNASIVIALLLVVILIMLFRKFRYLFAFWKKKNYISHYRVMDKIASGGMGTIYRAHDIRNKTNEYAVKVLREEYSSDEAYKKRFKNEAVIIDQLTHPNIVKVIERGEYEDNLYIAMELLDGESLFDILEKEEKLEISDAINIMVQIADALAKIHQKNIIHRDLKPENIMIIKTEDNPYFVKVLDFGLAKTQSLTRLTQTGIIMGSIFYLSPEQISNKEVSTASDIYSLGIIYYQMLSGEKPFFAESAMEIAKQILDKEPIEPARFQKDIPEELNQLIMDMISKNPDQRPTAEKVLNIIKGIKS